MGQKDTAGPDFSAGPLLMPAIQVKGLSCHAAAVSLSRNFPQPNFAPRNGRMRISLWPCLRKLGNRCLYGARVVPLTLSNVLREDESGSPDMHRDEAGRWVPGAKKPPATVGLEAVPHRKTITRAAA